MSSFHEQRLVIVAMVRSATQNPYKNSDRMALPESLYSVVNVVYQLKYLQEHKTKQTAVRQPYEV